MFLIEYALLCRHSAQQGFYFAEKNGAWHIFTMEGTEVAAGGWISNIVRIISIALAIAITVYYHKKRGGKIFDYPIWEF